LCERTEHDSCSWECLQGCIDQVDGLIYFDTDAKELQQWDNQIQSVCTQLNQIMDTFAARSIQAA